MLLSRNERLAAETEQQREARLQSLSARRNERLAAETEQQREAKLQSLSARRNERLAAETREHRGVYGFGGLERWNAEEV